MYSTYSIYSMYSTYSAYSMFLWILWHVFNFHNAVWCHVACDVVWMNYFIFTVCMGNSHTWSCNSFRIYVPMLAKWLCDLLRKEAVAFETSCVYSVVLCFKTMDRQFLSPAADVLHLAAMALHSMVQLYCCLRCWTERRSLRSWSLAITRRVVSCVTAFRLNIMPPETKCLFSSKRRCFQTCCAFRWSRKKRRGCWRRRRFA